MNQKYRTCLTVAIVFAALLLTNAIHAATDTNRTALADIYKIVSKALKEKDLNTISSYETDDYSSKTLSGKTQNREESDASLKEGLATLKTISSFEEKIIEAKFENDTATVTVSETLTATISDPEGKDHTVKGLTKARDIWVKKDGKWKIKSSEMIEDKSTLDGEAVR